MPAIIVCAFSCFVVEAIFRDVNSLYNSIFLNPCRSGPEDHSRRTIYYSCMTLIQKYGGVNIFVIKVSYLSNISSSCVFINRPNHFKINDLRSFRIFSCRFLGFALVLGFQLCNVANGGYMWT